MEDCVVSVIAKAAEYLVGPAIRRGQYLFCIKKFIKNLEKTKDELTSKRDGIQNLARRAEDRTEIIENHVKKWLNDVKNLLGEAEILKQEVEANNNCFHGCCHPWKRYHLCKQMAKKTEKMTELKDKNEFEPFSHLASLPGIEYEASDHFSYFNSTKLAYNQIMEALQDDSTHIIGLYGMGGAGKTSLAIEVGEKAEKLNLFDLVMKVTVSQTLNIEKIQKEMSDFLELKFKEESEEGKKRRLWLRLRQEKQVLIIVDDVWGEINLKDIAIDFDPSQKGSCKILLTTRRRQVCILMGCQKEIKLELLSDEEAWTLFRKYASIDDQYSYNILNIAWEVARECKGLPIAIKAVASSLKGKFREFEVDEWKVALKKLKDSKPLDEEGEKAFSGLQLSYDYLKNKEVQLLFLMCAMFPEDHEIPVEELIRYGTGLGVCGEFESFDLARSQVRVGLNKLLDSCLLMSSEKKRDDHVKMHDLVRDTALWISSKEDRTIMVNTEKDLNSSVGNGVTKKYFAVSSWYQNIHEISFQWDAPKLEILILCVKSSQKLSCASFDGMKGLKVMAIINEQYDGPLLLPQSIQSLTNLRTLCLRGWDLDDISLIVNLRKLEVLDLQYCSFKEVPKGIESLNKLKLLDLTKSRVMENYNSKGIARCPLLEEFYVSGDLRNPLQSFVHDLAFTNLQRYELLLGGSSYMFGEKDVSSMRILKIKDFHVSTIVGSKNHLLQKAEDVEFICLHGGCKNVIPDLVRAVGGINELRTLRLSSCEEINCLTDADSFQENSLLPRLVKLELYYLLNLKELCRGRPVLGFFDRLQELAISSCENLSNIFPREGKFWNLKILTLKACGVVTIFSISIARSLQQLEELTVENFDELREIIKSEGDEISLAINNSHSIFPNLKKLIVYFCHKLQFVFPISCGHQGLAQLQEIRISECDELKYVFGPYDHDYDNSSQDQNEMQIMLPSLQVFKLFMLGNLIGICPQNCHASWPSLRELRWVHCPRLTWISSQHHPNVDGVILWEINTCSNQLSQQQILSVALQSFLNIKSIKLVDNCRVEGILKVKVEGGLHIAENSLHSNLEELDLEDLPELRFIWSGPISFLGFHKLKYVYVMGCSKLKTIFSPGIVGSLQNLEYLTIINCDELDEIITMSSDLKVVGLPKLESIEVKNCHKLKCLFSSLMGCDFPKLLVLNIKECNKLKCLFSGSMTCNLPKLFDINIQKCFELEKVFHFKPTEADDDYDKDHGVQQLVLPELKILTLESLPNFIEIEKLEMQIRDDEPIDPEDSIALYPPDW